MILRLFILVFALALAGCSGSPVKLPPQTGGTLVQALVGDPTTFNPAIARRGSSLEVTRLLFAGLLAPAADGQFQPELAQNFQVAEDGRRFRLSLRSGLLWSDGERLEAEDVVFTFKRVYQSEGSPIRLVTGLEVEAIDALTVEFRLPAADPGFVSYLSLPILPAHSFKDGENPAEAWGLDFDPTTLPVSGPFFCSTYVAGQKLVLTANPRYWRRPEQPYLAQLYYTIVPDRAAARSRFESGTLDTYPLIPEDYAPLSDARSGGNFSLVSGGPRPEAVFLSFNLNLGRNGKAPLVDPIASAWFNSTTFRGAIAAALDRQAMVSAVWLNTAVAAEHPYDLEAAKASLKKAGFNLGEDGKLLDSRRNPVRFTLLTDADDPQILATARRAQGDLQALGIEVEVRPLPRLALRNRVLRTLDWQAVLTSLPDLGASPVESASVWRSDSPWHLFNLQSEAIKGRKASDWEVQLDETSAATAGEGQAGPDERKQIIKAQQPLIALVRPLLIVAVRNGIFERRVNAVETEYYGRVFGNIWEVQKAPAANPEEPVSTP